MTEPVDSATDTSPPPLGDVSATCLITLFARALESGSHTPLLSDAQAEALAEKLRPSLRASEERLHQNLARSKMPAQAQVYLAMRARRFDAWATDFLGRHPDGAVVNLGCGMDTRYHRLREAGVTVSRFLDLDLPEVIHLKGSLLAEEPPRYRMVGCSVLDHGWMDELAPPGERPPPTLFLAEGLLMYLDPADVRTLVLALRNRFGDSHGGAGAELVAEMINARWTTPFWRKQIQRKMDRRMGVGTGAAFRFGIPQERELESWGDGLTFLEDWSHVDEPEPRVGLARWFRRFDLMRKSQWAVRYRLS